MTESELVAWASAVGVPVIIAVIEWAKKEWHLPSRWAFPMALWLAFLLIMVVGRELPLGQLAITAFMTGASASGIYSSFRTITGH